VSAGGVELYVGVRVHGSDDPRQGPNTSFDLDPSSPDDAISAAMGWVEKIRRPERKRIVTETRNPDRIREDQMAIEAMEDDGWVMPDEPTYDRDVAVHELLFRRGRQFVELQVVGAWIEVACAGALDSRGRPVTCEGLVGWSTIEALTLREALIGCVAGSDAVLRLLDLGFVADPAAHAGWAVLANRVGTFKTSQVDCYVRYNRKTSEVLFKLQSGRDNGNTLDASAADPRTWQALAEIVRLSGDGAGTDEIMDAARRILA
jgi:hypothetical protein